MKKQELHNEIVYRESIRKSYIHKNIYMSHNIALSNLLSIKLLTANLKSISSTNSRTFPMYIKQRKNKKNKNNKVTIVPNTPKKRQKIIKLLNYSTLVSKLSMFYLCDNNAHYINGCRANFVVYEFLIFIFRNYFRFMSVLSTTRLHNYAG